MHVFKVTDSTTGVQNALQNHVPYTFCETELHEAIEIIRYHQGDIQMQTVSCMMIQDCKRGSETRQCETKIIK